MKKKVNNAGFSLVEVILAMAILAILAIPLLNYFVESMKYNARMSQEQHATLLAQETVEDLKSQDQLIALTTRPDGTSGYQSNYLEGLGYASISSDASGVSYYGAADAVHKDYDVTITVNADTAENQKLLPQISGIDDTCDVLAKESGQADAALAWFQEVNRIYADRKHNSGLILSEDTIRGRMQRTMQCTIEKEGSYYRVVISCAYSCQDLKETGSVDQYQCTDLCDQLVKDVKHIYLFYHAGKKPDTMEILPGTGVDLSALKTELYLVNQDTTLPSGYRFQLKGTLPVICSNLDQSQILDRNGAAISSKKDLVQESEGTRRIEIEVKVYKKGEGNTSGKKPYVTLHAAKGE